MGSKLLGECHCMNNLPFFFDHHCWHCLDKFYRVEFLRPAPFITENIFCDKLTFYIQLILQQVGPDKFTFLKKCLLTGALDLLVGISGQYLSRGVSKTHVSCFQNIGKFSQNQSELNPQLWKICSKDFLPFLDFHCWRISELTLYSPLQFGLKIRVNRPSIAAALILRLPAFGFSIVTSPSSGINLKSPARLRPCCRQGVAVGRGAA